MSTTTFHRFFNTGVAVLAVTVICGLVLHTTSDASAASISLAFSASATNIVAGNGSTLSWSATNAKSCLAKGAWSGTKATSGTYAVTNLRLTSTYTITCYPKTSGSSVSASRTIHVYPKMAAPSGYTKLVFDDTFRGKSLDTTKWITQMVADGGRWDDNGRLPAPYSAVGNEGQFNAEYGNPDQVVVDNGVTLNATRDNTFPGYTWKAGYLMTQGKFSFSGGFAQFRARLPDSRTGAWASFWFLQGGGEIDLNESGYTHCGTTAVNYCFAANLHTSGNAQTYYKTSTDLSAAYHVYGMQYQPGKLVAIYLDGKKVASYTKNVPTGSMIIVMTETMATPLASGWHTVTSSATPSPVNPNFRIIEAQVWQ